MCSPEDTFEAFYAIQCPHCKWYHERVMRTKNCSCPHCKRAFPWPEERKEEMPATFCPECKTPMVQLADEHEAKCPGCNKRWKVMDPGSMKMTYEHLVHEEGGAEKAVEKGERKPILCLDFDGVCHRYDSGWKGPANIPDGPVDGLFDFLALAVLEFEVHIFSSRSHQPGGIDAMQTWLTAHEHHWWRDGKTKPFDMFSITARLHFPTEKPPATVGLDDRVMQFKGEWPTIEELKNFKPWNKQEA